MSLCVLCFHRVTDTFDPIGLSVTTQSFRKLIGNLSMSQRIVPLKDALQYIEGKEVYYAITFDDGYSDLQDYAIPFMAELDIPASIFIPSYYTVTQKPFWWEVAALIILQGITLPLSKPDDKEEDIISLLKAMTFNERAFWLSKIAVGDGSKLPRSLGSSELTSLPANFEICSHGHTHTVCSLMSENDFYDELIMNRNILKDLPHYNSSLFAYPNGTNKDFNESNKTVLALLDFKAAFSTIDGINTENNPFDLKRTVVTRDNIEALSMILQKERGLDGETYTNLSL